MCGFIGDELKTFNEILVVSHALLSAFEMSSLCRRVAYKYRIRNSCPQQFQTFDVLFDISVRRGHD